MTPCAAGSAQCLHIGPTCPRSFEATRSEVGRQLGHVQHSPDEARLGPNPVKFGRTKRHLPNTLLHQVGPSLLCWNHTAQSDRAVRPYTSMRGRARACVNRSHPTWPQSLKPDGVELVPSSEPTPMLCNRAPALDEPRAHSLTTALPAQIRVWPNRVKFDPKTAEDQLR